jgi:hypothetical protein
VPDASAVAAPAPGQEAPSTGDHGAEGHGFDLFPTHHFQWAPTDAKNVQVGVNFGLLQLALGGFNVAAEVRYRRSPTAR